MRAIRIPYPQKNPHPWERWDLMREYGMVVDFPDRHVSYVFYDFPRKDFGSCAVEIEKAVSLHAPGTEPPLLEIRFSD